VDRRAFIAGTLALLAAPLAAEFQPALEQFWFEPPRLCLRDTFRWGFSYRAFPGGLAAVKDFVMEGLWEGPGEQPIRSALGRFESRPLHWSPPRARCG
jgi:hypothetical protein